MPTAPTPPPATPPPPQEGTSYLLWAGVVLAVLVLAAGVAYFFYPERFANAPTTELGDGAAEQQPASDSVEDLEAELSAEGDADLRSDLSSLEDSF